MSKSSKGKSYRRETVEATVKKQKECSAKALKIVETLIEKDVTEELLLQNVYYVNQACFQDIIDERSIVYLCGYPVCNKELKDIPKQQYKITRTNGTLLLYDTTERKKFCSNICYKSAKYLKDQLPSCPLWLIEWKDSQSIKLITADCNSGGSLGDEVSFSPSSEDSPDLEFDAILKNYYLNKKLTGDKYQSSTEENGIKVNRNTDSAGKGSRHDDDDDDDDDQEYKDAVDSGSILSNEIHYSSLNSVSISYDKALDELSPTDEIQDGKTIKDDDRLCDENNECNLNSVDCKRNALSNSSVISSEVDKHDACIASCNNELTIYSLEASKINIEGNNENTKCLSSDTCSITARNENNDVIDNKKVEFDKIVNKNKLKKHKSKLKKEKDVSPMLAAVLRTEQRIREWISLDTLVFLLGEDKLKKIIEETCGSEKFNIHTKTSTEDPVVYERYLAICKKLNLLELHESKIDNSLKSDASSVVGPLNPVPDYERLKEEAKEFEIKVKSFYRGDKQVQFKEENPVDKSENDLISIPLVDQHAQKALRRRILLDHLNRALPDLLRALGLSKYVNNIIAEVKILVETFTLSAHNVMFRPAEWNFVAIVIIKLLAVHDALLNQILSMEKANKYLTLMLMSYGQDSEYLNRIVTWLLYEHPLFTS